MSAARLLLLLQEGHAVIVLVRLEVGSQILARPELHVARRARVRTLALVYKESVPLQVFFPCERLPTSCTVVRRLA